MKNKFGFTSIELLTVIFVLSIFSLGAIIGVNYLLNNTKKEVFMNDVQTIIQSASVAYTTLNAQEVTCFTYDYLKNNNYYIGKGSYNGSILVTKTEEAFIFNVWLSNQTFGYDKISLNKDMLMDKSKIEKMTRASKNCDGFVGKIYE